VATIKELAGTPQTLEASGGSCSNNAAVQANDANLDNTTELGFTYDFTLSGGFGSSVTAGGAIQLYLVPIIDGTNVATLDSSTPLFQPSHFRGTFVTPTNGTSARLMTVEGVPLGPYKYQAWLWNQSGQTLSSTWVLVAYPVKAQN
jgi:hypothetical protein